MHRMFFFLSYTAVDSFMQANEGFFIILKDALGYSFFLHTDGFDRDCD